MLLIRIILCCIIPVFLSLSVSAAKEPYVSAESAVLINADTHEIIYEKNAYECRSMASTTKIMTALLACESGKLDETVTAENCFAEGTSIGLKKGYKLTLEGLVYGMLLESGNDAAKLTANFLAGDEEGFSLMMNRKAAEIGMTSTNFVTASGLDAEEHYSTAYDMALLGAYSVTDPIFRDICSTKSKEITFTFPEMKATFYNHNRLLSSCEGVFGIKTGFTKKSGRCLVSACERDGMTLVCVTLNAPDDWNDHKKLYDFGYNSVKKVNLILLNGIEEVSVYGGKQSFAAISVKNRSINLPYTHSNKYSIKVFLPKIIYAPLKSGDIIGKIQVFYKNKLVMSEDIISCENVEISEEKQPKWYEKIINLFKN